MVVEVDLSKIPGRAGRLRDRERRAARSDADLYGRHQRLHGEWRRWLRGFIGANNLIDRSGAVLMATQVIDYVSAAGTIAPAVEGRIKFL